MMWYYVKDGARQGPVDEADFNRLVGQGTVRAETLVWSEGMSDWRPYSTGGACPSSRSRRTIAHRTGAHRTHTSS